MSTDKPLHELTATEIARAVKAKKVTCEAVARACLERIALREPEVGAWHYLNPEQVIAQARALDRSGASGPLAGVPIGYKDIIDTADMPTEYGSPIYRGHRPASDAACVALSRKAGAIVMGKTVTTEFANQYPGKTRNPFDPTRTPGGSSSGSAAAVGDSMVPLAVGTQTTGSTVRPASFCGAFGYRPTYGELRCVGVKEAAGSLDTLGLIARSVEDIALFRDVLLGVPPRTVGALSGAPRIGFCRTHIWKAIEPHTQKLLENAAAKLESVGARVKEIVLPPDFDTIEETHRRISTFEFARNFTWELENHREGISQRLRDGRIKDGLECSYAHYVEGRKHADALRAQFDSVFGDCDVLLTAAATGEAPIGTSSTGNVAPSTIWTTVYAPSITIPVFKGPNGLPIGAQLVAPRHEDERLFSVAQWAYRQLALS